MRRRRLRLRRRRMGCLLVGLLVVVIGIGSCQTIRERRQGRDDASATGAPTSEANGPTPAEGGADSTEPTDERAGAPVVRVTELVQGGGRIDWSPDGSRLVFDMPIDENHYELFTASPDGSEQRCLTCDHPDLPEGRHRGNPAWHPSGEHIVFQVEKAVNPGGSRRATPGIGVANDLWLITADGAAVSQLTDLSPESGVLHPQFSHSGDRLSWSQQIGVGGTLNQWDLRVADFALENGQPRLSNERRYDPTPGAFHENGGFSPDDSHLIFAANRGQDDEELDLDIFTLELATETLTQLTGPDGEWDEHGHFSPDGEHIIWMSSRENGWDGSMGQLATDYWIMNRDGSDQRRLTHFNQPGHPESSENRLVVGDYAWAPDGTRIGAYYIISQGARRLFMQYDNAVYRIVEIDLTTVIEPSGPSGHHESCQGPTCSYRRSPL